MLSFIAKNLGGTLPVPGALTAEDKALIDTANAADPKGEALRRMVCLEPRGAPIGSVNLVLPAKNLFEQTDVIGAYWHPYLQLRPKVLEPPPGGW